MAEQQPKETVPVDDPVKGVPAGTVVACTTQEFTEGDRVVLRGTVKQVDVSESNCNVTIDLDNPPDLPPEGQVAYRPTVVVHQNLVRLNEETQKAEGREKDDAAINAERKTKRDAAAAGKTPYHSKHRPSPGAEKNKGRPGAPKPASAPKRGGKGYR